MNDHIQSYMTYLQEEKKVSHNTLMAYKRDLAKLNRYLADRNVTDIHQVTESQLKDYVQFMLDNGQATSSVARSVASIKDFFSQLEGSPAYYIKAPKIIQKELSVLSAAELQLLMNQPKTDSVKGMRDKAMLELMYATGMHVTELVSLRLSDLHTDETGTYLTCGSPRSRQLQLPPATVRILNSYLEDSRDGMLSSGESEYLFTNCNGKPMSRQGFWKIIKFYSSEANIQKEITPNTLRHSFAYHHLQDGMTPIEVNKVLGHTDMTVTNQYVARMRAYAEKLQQLQKGE